MSKIIVAIDFSDCSINAFFHALSIAQHCSNDILLVWVEKPSSEKDKFEKQAGDPSREVKKQFEELISKYQPELTSNTITYKLRTGTVYKEITMEAKESKAKLVIAGTHGASGFEEFWIGSNANKIVSASPCPVITIRAGINVQRPLTKIVLPIDSTLETRQKATFTGQLAKKHNAEIHILSLYSSSVKAIRREVNIYAGQVELYYKQEGIKYQMASMECTNISDAMIEYAMKTEANLISIMTEQESKTSNLWMGPYAHQTVNHSPIPVLSIHSKETYSAGSAF
jgi:nucleotide-binding universal stress UspA family protein